MFIQDECITRDILSSPFKLNTSIAKIHLEYYHKYRQLFNKISVMSIDNQTHKGHRDRLKEKLIRFGPEIFSDHELLEMLLFFSIPRVNTNSLAHRLIDRFGSLNAVLTSPIDQLVLVEGMGNSSAILVSLVGALMLRARRMPISKRKKFSSLSEVGEMLTDYYRNLPQERFCALYFDASMRLVEMTVIAEGSIGEVSVTPSRIAREAVLKGASGVIVAHNHPLGASSLSSSDRNLTHIIEASLAAVDIPLIEHIVVGEVGYAPTMMYKPGSSGALRSARVYGDAFAKSFYSF